MADRRLQVFHAVAKQSSFTKAAETLFMTQPAVTFQIKQLEEHFNTRLFDRGHGKISLTAAGEVVLEYAEKILSLSAELDTRVSELTGEIQGLLLIGASMTIAEFMLPRVLGEFKVAYPGVKARLTVANSETVEHGVAAHSLDIGLIEAPSHLPGLSTEDCCEDELQVVCSPAHPLAKFKAVTPKQLMQHPYINREPGSGTREVTDSYFRRAGFAAEDMNIGDGTGQPGCDQGRGRNRLGLCHHVQGDRGQGKTARRAGGAAARAQAHAHALAGLSEGKIPLAPGHQLCRVFQGQAEELRQGVSG